MSNVKLTTESKNWEVSAARLYNIRNDLTLDASGAYNIILKTNGFNRATFNNSGLVLEPSGNTITTRQNVNLILDASNSNISFRRNGTERMRITDASSIFLNNVDLSANNLVNVNNITVSRATPQTDASYNFTTVRIATDASSRDIAIPSPYYGQACFLLNTNTLQFYNNGAWFNINSTLNQLIYVSGEALPTPIYVNSSNTIVSQPVIGGSTIYKFVVTTNQYTSTTYGVTISNATSGIHFLCVGGGGGAAAYYSCGGGGAGGFRTSYTTTQGTSGRGGAYESTLTLTNSTTYTITVGGGSRGVPGDGTSYSGGPTSVAQGFASIISGSGLTTITSYGGSPGACNQAGATKPQDYVNQVATGSQPSAGCGGGARGEATNGTNIAGTGTTGQGYDGGGNNAGTYAGNYPGGGGGGAGSVGGQVTTTTTAGNGGAGLQSAITGTAQYYAGGGGGSTQAAGSSDPASSGGSGVGGTGRGGNGVTLLGGDGSANTGSGGGAGCNSGNPSSGKGGDGSAGIVVIRIPSYI